MTYRKDIKLFSFRIVSKPWERHELIEKAHNFGHLAAAKTYNRFKGKYFWHNMINDIVLV